MRFIIFNSSCCIQEVFGYLQCDTPPTPQLLPLPSPQPLSAHWTEWNVFPTKFIFFFARWESCHGDSGPPPPHPRPKPCCVLSFCLTVNSRSVSIHTPIHLLPLLFHLQHHILSASASSSSSCSSSSFICLILPLPHPHYIPPQSAFCWC